MSKENKDTEVVSISIEPFIKPLLVFLSVLVFSVSFSLAFINGMYHIRKGLELSGTGIGTNRPNNDLGTQPEPEKDPEMPILEISTGDAPRVGNNNAKVAIMEFSDFNCGFCQRHHTDGTAKAIMSNYVESGDILHIYRSIPGNGGDFSRRASAAALCFREQTNDEAYYEMIDKIYTFQTTTGKDETTVREIITKDFTNVNLGSFDSCVSEGKYADVVENELADATKLAQGMNSGVVTPMFIVGELDDNGNIVGRPFSGALPLASFQAAIAEWL